MDSTRNSALEHHLLEAGFTPARLAEQLGIDEKTVQRWLAGRCRPYLRHQYAVATALRVDRRDLWPDPVAAPGAVGNDLVTLYESRLDIPNRLWTDLTAVPGDVEILTTDLRWFLENHPVLGAEMNCHALEGARVHLTLLDSDLADSTSTPEALETAAAVRRTLAFLDPMLDIDRAINSQIRLHSGSPLTIYRFGSEMLVHHALSGLPDSLAPAWHLRRTVEDGPFDRYLVHLRHVWTNSSPVPKHRRDMPSGGPQLIPPELVGIDGARADAFRARARTGLRTVLKTWLDESQSVHYDLGPELFQLLLPAVGAHERLRNQRHPHVERPTTRNPAAVEL